MNSIRLLLVCLTVVACYEQSVKDRFRGKVPPEVQISEFVSIKNPVDSGHDAFHGKSSDKPTTSNFKATSGDELVFDNFRGKVGPDRSEDYSQTSKKFVDVPFPIFGDSSQLNIKPLPSKFYVEPANKPNDKPEELSDYVLVNNLAPYKGVYSGEKALPAQKFVYELTEGNLYQVVPSSILAPPTSSGNMNYLPNPSVKFIPSSKVATSNDQLLNSPMQFVSSLKASSNTDNNVYSFVDSRRRLESVAGSSTEATKWIFRINPSTTTVIPEMLYGAPSSTTPSTNSEMIFVSSSSKPFTMAATTDFASSTNPPRIFVSSKPSTMASSTMTSSTMASSTMASVPSTTKPPNVYLRKLQNNNNNELNQPRQLTSPKKEGFFANTLHDLNETVIQPTSVSTPGAKGEQTQPVDTQMEIDESNVRQDPRCHGLKDGTNIMLKPCRRTYSQCKNGQAEIRFCTNARSVFSNEHGFCVLKVIDPECRHLTQFPMKKRSRFFKENSFNSDTFCIDRADGFYRHPLNCSGIIQCFGKMLFQYPSCNYNLAYDEAKGVCDYADQVDGCSLSSTKKPQSDRGASKDVNVAQNLTIINNTVVMPPLTHQSSETSSASSGCNGHKHGDHLQNKADSTTFYRCVWDRLILMSCPTGTVFNPRIDVCDYAHPVDSSMKAKKA